MHVIYKTTYLPHLGTNYPKYYIGSKYNYYPGYFGSVSTKRSYEYTENLSLCLWWKNKIKTNPEQFSIEFLYVYDNISTEELLDKELEIQILLNCKGDDYFNQCYARGKWVSHKNSIETKKLKSEKTKEFWDSEEGKLKKERLAERNRKSKSDEMKIRWEDEEYREKTLSNLHSAPKVSMSLEGRKKISDLRISEAKEIEFLGIYYKGHNDLYRRQKVSKRNYELYYKEGIYLKPNKKFYLNGIDPSTLIGKKRK